MPYLGIYKPILDKSEQSLGKNTKKPTLDALVGDCFDQQVKALIILRFLTIST